MKFIIPIAALALVLSGCNHMFVVLGGPQVKGSGKVKSESRKVGSFTRIESNGSADCTVSVGKPLALKVEADDNILPLIETKVVDGVLRIDCKGSFSTRNPIRVTVGVPSLDAFTTKGSGDSTIAGVSAPVFDAAILGSGNIKASGQADRATANIKGSGDIDLSKLRAKDGEATISGSGDIEIFASHSLEAVIRGSGDIAYYGNPTVHKSIFGSGDVVAK